MAKAISNIERIVVDEETKKQQDLREIEQTLIDNKEAVLETITVIGNLHDRGMLELVNGLLSQGDEVFRILIQEINKPDNSRVIENLVGLVELLGMIDIGNLKELTGKANNGLKEAIEGESDEGPSNVFQLMKALKDPEINRSVAMLLKFLKGMGQQ